MMIVAFEDRKACLQQTSRVIFQITNKTSLIYLC